MEIKLMPLARVEGEGGIYIEIEENKVKTVRVEIYEGPRLIETILLGKQPEEAVSISTRICAICTISHRLASIKAIERALGLKISEKLLLLRRLAHYGEIIESHSLHYYLLALPDFFGFPDAVSMNSKYPDIVRGGLELKKFGNFIMESINGRAVHGENLRIGEVGEYPSDRTLEEIKDLALSLIPVIEDGIMFFPYMDVEDYMEEETNFLALEPENGGYGFDGENILISTGEKYAVEEYKTITGEFVVPHSFAKRSRYKEKPFTVGALARINILGEKLSGRAGEFLRRVWSERWKKNPLFNNPAQAIEILHCLENIPFLVEKLISMENPDNLRIEKTEGEGTGAVEAPRGTLIHSYNIKNGKLSYADIVTPTAQNLEDMERYIRNSCENLLRKEDKDMELKIEMIARAYDPCISCSAHYVKIKKR